MMKRYTIIIALLVIAFLPSGCGPRDEGPILERSDIHLTSPEGAIVTVHAEIALSPAEQERGLMGRTSLQSDEGMLFVFARSMAVSFWMKNTLMPLDILFFDDAGKMVSTTTMQPCQPSASHCPSYRSAGPAMYALEVPAGFVAGNSIDREWTLGLQPWGRR